MSDGQKEVPCAISTPAMDYLGQGPRAKPEQREAQFTRFRDRIEACAAAKYRAAELEGKPPGVVLRGIDFRSWGKIEGIPRRSLSRTLSRVHRAVGAKRAALSFQWRPPNHR